MLQQSVRLTEMATGQNVVFCAALRCPKVAAEFGHRTTFLRFSARKWQPNSGTEQYLLRFGFQDARPK